MPVHNGIGYGPHTPDKQAMFLKLMEYHIPLTLAVQHNCRIKQWPHADLDTYWYFDITAGAGQDPTGEAGSPLLFLDVARRHQLSYQAILIEQEWQNAFELAKQIHDPRVQIVQGDHHQRLPAFFAKADRRFGLLYCDTSGNIPPFDLLARMSQLTTYSRLDFCIYVFANNLKRVRCAAQTAEKRHLLAMLGTIAKKEWIVREPVGHNQASFLLGSNWVDFPAWEKEGFYSITRSRYGREILNRITFTKDELVEMAGQGTFNF